MANWLKNASTVSAPNPYQRQIFRGGKAKGVGTPLLIIDYLNKYAKVLCKKKKSFSFDLVYPS